MCPKENKHETMGLPTPLFSPVHGNSVNKKTEEKVACETCPCLSLSLVVLLIILLLYVFDKLSENRTCTNIKREKIVAFVWQGHF